MKIMHSFLKIIFLLFFVMFQCLNSIECNNMQPFNNVQSRTSKAENSKNCLLRGNFPFKDSFRKVNNSEKWHNFLNALYCKFSEYKVQVARRGYKVSDFVGSDFKKQECEIEELRDSKTQMIQINENNLGKFFKKTANCNLSEYNNIENMKITESQIEEINHILRLTLNNLLHVTCVGSHIFIKGNYITTGDVRDILYLRNDVRDAKCKNLLLRETSKFINIFALNTFFIDISINSSFTKAHKIEQFIVISPKWETIGRNKIELKGEDGKAPEVTNDIDGKPGQPGEPGGIFFGIGNEFTNGKNLTISASGGDGSHGQEGKKGKDGRDGDTPHENELNASYLPCNSDLCYSRIVEFRNYKCTLYDHIRMGLGHLDGIFFKVFGENGSRGRNGGKGGKGGKGGNPGNVIFFELNNNSEISILNNSGNNGKDGKGGLGGVGGKKGSDLILNCKPHIFARSLWKTLTTYTSNERAESGENGADGANYNGMVNPKAACNLKNSDKAKIINQYKSYLRENLNDRFTHSFLNSFLMQLEVNNKVNSVYDTLSLIEDLQLLEEQFPKLNQGINFAPFYQSLLDRISNYVKSHQEIGDPNQYKKVLIYIYTAALGRVHNMEENFETYLIVDVQAYLQSIKKDIDKLKDLENAKFKGELINKYTEDYKHEIDITIKEAKEIISDEIIPELDNIGTDIDKQFESLLDEVMFLKKQAITEREALIKKQQQLQNTLALQGIFSVLKIFGQVAKFLGPMGEIAGSVIDAGSSVAETFISGNGESENKAFKLPQSVSELESINGILKIIKDKKITRLRSTIKYISAEITQHPDILGNLSKKIVSIKERLDKVDKNKLTLLEVQGLENELQAVLKMNGEASSQNTGKEKIVIENLKRIVRLNTLMSEAYNKYKNNKGKLGAINEAIAQAEEKFEKLAQYEQKIYNTIMPMLQNIQNDLQCIISKLGTKSQVALDVTKWSVKSTLRDMTILMRELTRGFKAEDNLHRCIEKLEDTMVILINVHKHVQEYQKDKKFASFIGKVSSITTTDINIVNNPEIQTAFRNAIRDLEITVRSSIVVERYKIGINAFKQFVFPFAHTYFKGLILPSHLEFDDDENNTTLSSLVRRAVSQVETINSKLQEYKNIVTKRDRCIGIGGFESGYVSSKPFFVWENEKHKSMISKLLSGERITVKADVQNSAPKKDAIKFNVIKFHFKSKNETLQPAINDKLKGFMVYATHLGNSYYRYENKIYEIKTASQEIWYHFEKRPDGEPLYYSLSYSKIKDGNLTLSPYASWILELDTVGDYSSFQDLENYKDAVDLVLEGYGHYINKKSKACVDLMVGKYYKSNDVYSQELSNPNLNAVNISTVLQNKYFPKFKSKFYKELGSSEYTRL